MPVENVGGNRIPNYDPNNSGSEGVTRKQLSPAMLEILRQFGLEGDTELQNELLNLPEGNPDMSSLLSASDKLDGMDQGMADVFTVMLLIAKMSRENRETSRQIRDAEQQLELKSMQEGADKIREAADFALAAGIVSGVLKMGSGAISIGGGLKGMKDLKGVKPGSDGADLKLEQIRAEGRVFDGSGQMVTGLGDVAAAGLNRAAEEARAEEKELDATAKEHEMLAQKEQDFAQVNTEVIAKMADLMKQIIQLNTESEKAAATI